MKRLRWIPVLMFMLFSFASVSSFAQNKTKKKEVVVFELDEMCQHCVNKIQKNIPFEKGVAGLKTYPEKRKVEIIYRIDKTDEDKLQEALTRLDVKVLSKISTKVEESVKNNRK